MTYQLPIKTWILLIGFGLITGCGSTNPNLNEDSSAPNSSETTAEESQMVAAGTHCFELESQTLSSTIQFNIASDGSVTGSSEGLIHDEAQGYYSSYTQNLEGFVKGEQLELAVTTNIENDIQEEQETWTLSTESLNTGRQTYPKVECSQGRQPSSTTSTQTEQQSSGPIRVKFDPGTNSTVLENSVVRGTRDTYLLNAREEQTLKLSITSLENNAVFDLLDPTGDVMEQELTDGSFTLPATGDYQIIVGGTRGNATYQLQVAIN